MPLRPRQSPLSSTTFFAGRGGPGCDATSMSYGNRARTMVTPTSRSRIVSGVTCAGAIVLLAAGARAQGVPGKPGGEWLPYRAATLTSEYMQRCAVSPAVLAQWRKTVDEVVAIVATSPALTGLAGHVPEIVSHVDAASPPGGTDCRKYALAASVVLWPWMDKHVEPDPAARPGGPNFRLKGYWVNNTFGALWVWLNAIPKFAGDPWEKDDRGVFFEQPERLREVAGFPMYEDHIFIAGPSSPPLFLPVSQERMIQAYLVRARSDAPISTSTLESRKKQYETFMSPASQEKRKKEIEAAAASQKNPDNSEQARKHAMAIDKRREEDYRKAANPPPDDPVFEPVRRLKQAEALLAGMTEAERKAPAWRTSPQGAQMLLNLARPNAPGARAVVEVNPAYFDFSAPRATLRNALIWVKEGMLTRKLGTGDLDVLTKVDRAVVFQTDWTRLAQMMK